VFTPEQEIKKRHQGALNSPVGVADMREHARLPWELNQSLAMQFTNHFECAPKLLVLLVIRILQRPPLVIISRALPQMWARVYINLVTCSGEHPAATLLAS